MIDTATIESLEKIAAKLHKAGVFPAEVNTSDKAFAILLAGDELGFAPMAAARSIALVKGKVSLGADAQIGLCKRSGACKYFHLVESTETLATYITHREGDPEPTALTYTIEMAQKAGLAGSQTWRSHPKAMLRARCGAALSRAVYPDVCAGLYDPDEAEEIRRNDGPGRREPIAAGNPEHVEGPRDDAPAQPAPLDALDAFRAVLAECGDLATIAAAYQGAGLGGTSMSKVREVIAARTKALGYFLSSAEIAALCGGTLDDTLAAEFGSLAEIAVAEDMDDHDVVAGVVRVLRRASGMRDDLRARVEAVAVETVKDQEIADPEGRIAGAMYPALGAFLARIAEIELPGECIAVWRRHRGELATLPAAPRELAWKRLCDCAGEVGRMKAPKVWLKKAIAEEDARDPQPPPDGGPSGTRTPAAPTPDDATAAPLATTAANDAVAQASAGPRVVLDADETEARYLRDDAIGAEAWAAHLTACAAIFAMAGAHTKRAEAFRAAGVLATRRAQTLDAIAAREGRGPEAAMQALDGYRTRRVAPIGQSVRARTAVEIRAAQRTGTDG